MPCEDETERCGVGGHTDLRIVRLSQWFYKETPITLVSGDVMEKAGYDRLIIVFYLSVSLWVVCSRFHVFCTEMGAQGANDFDDKLCTVVSNK